VQVIFDNLTGFVSAVDGTPVMLGRKGWDVPIRITPGLHTIVAEFNYGDFVGRSKLTFSAYLDERYQLLFKTENRQLGVPDACHFWIVDIKTGKTVSTVVTAFVDSGSSRHEYTPVFIPRR
jgi:hypothetical protein